MLPRSNDSSLWLCMGFSELSEAWEIPFLSLENILQEKSGSRNRDHGGFDINLFLRLIWR